MDRLIQRFAENGVIDAANADRLFNAVLFHARQPERLVLGERARGASHGRSAWMENRTPDFKREMRDFIGMCLHYYAPEEKAGTDRE